MNLENRGAALLAESQRIWAGGKVCVLTFVTITESSNIQRACPVRSGPIFSYALIR
jgi:hypothetical protein